MILLMMLKLVMMMTIVVSKASILLINERRLFGRKKARSLTKAFSAEEALSLEEVSTLEKAVSILRLAMVVMVLLLMVMMKKTMREGAMAGRMGRRRRIAVELHRLGRRGCRREFPVHHRRCRSLPLCKSDTQRSRRKMGGKIWGLGVSVRLMAAFTRSARIFLCWGKKLSHLRSGLRGSTIITGLYVSKTNSMDKDISQTSTTC